MAESVREEKKALRKNIKNILSKIHEHNVAEQSTAVTKKVLSLPEFQRASSVSVFLSMPGKEINTTTIVQEALRQNKTVFIPYIHSDKQGSKAKTMDMLRLKDEADLSSLKPDPWGIPSIPAESIVDRENALGGKGVDRMTDGEYAAGLDLIFIPAMAFDRQNNRLGHGKGFYDRYLSRTAELRESSEETPPFPSLVGLALREQVLDATQSVPVTETDWKVDKVITAD